MPRSDVGSWGAPVLSDLLTAHEPTKTFRRSRQLSALNGHTIIAQGRARVRERAALGTQPLNSAAICEAARQRASDLRPNRTQIRRFMESSLSFPTCSHPMNRYCHPSLQGGAIHLFTVGMRAADATATFTIKNLTGEQSVEVLGENRKNGVFADLLAPWGVHLYRTKRLI